MNIKVWNCQTSCISHSEYYFSTWYVDYVKCHWFVWLGWLVVHFWLFKPLSHHKWRIKEVLLIDFISLLESHMVFTQAEEHKAVTAATANLPRPIDRSLERQIGIACGEVCMLRMFICSKPHFRVLKMFIYVRFKQSVWKRGMERLHGASMGTVAHRQEAQAVPDWETGGAGFTQRAVGGRPPPAPAHSTLMSLTHPGTRSTDWCSHHGKK